MKSLLFWLPLILIVSCNDVAKSKQAPSDHVLIEFAAALEEEQEKFLPPPKNTQPGP
jgi:hypothetical protein